MRKLFAIAIMSIFAWQGYVKFHPQPLAFADSTQDTQTDQALPGRVSLASFKCDGRTHCSQMTSCEEATFFLRNCPDVKMDGNNDGIPCERQWCK